MSTRVTGTGLAFVTATISSFAVFLNAYAVKRLDDATVYRTAKNAGLVELARASRRVAVPGADRWRERDRAPARPGGD